MAETQKQVAVIAVAEPDQVPQTSAVPANAENDPQTSAAPVVAENDPQTSAAAVVAEPEPQTPAAPVVAEPEPQTSAVRVVVETVEVPKKKVNYSFVPIPNEKLFICPYNPSHQVRDARYEMHMAKCRQNWEESFEGLGYKGLRMSCRYNISHVVPAPELTHHEKLCPEQYSVTGYMIEHKAKLRNNRVITQQNLYTTQGRPFLVSLLPVLSAEDAAERNMRGCNREDVQRLVEISDERIHKYHPIDPHFVHFAELPKDITQEWIRQAAYEVGK